jgi:hypothetical protein
MSIKLPDTSSAAAVTAEAPALAEAAAVVGLLLVFWMLSLGRLFPWLSALKGEHQASALF